MGKGYCIYGVFGFGISVYRIKYMVQKLGDDRAFFHVEIRKSRKV